MKGGGVNDDLNWEKKARQKRRKETKEAGCNRTDGREEEMT